MKKITAEKLLGKLGTMFFISFIIALILMPWIDGYHIKLFVHALISFFLACICFSSLETIEKARKK